MNDLLGQFSGGFNSILSFLEVIVVDVTTLGTLVPIGQVALVVLFVRGCVKSETEVLKVFVGCERLIVHCSV